MFATQRRVEFRDTDAAGIVHFSAFFPMMESAEHELLRSLGLSVMPRPTRPASPGNSSVGADPSDDLHVISWPRVAATCNYTAAARFEDLLRIDVVVAKIGTSSVTYRFEFFRDDVAIAQGEITAVCCRWKPAHHGPGELQKISIPGDIRELLQKHV